MTVMNLTSCSREPSSNALQPYKIHAKGIIDIRVKTQASSSLSKFVSHSIVYSKGSLNDSSSRIWKDRVEKLPRTPSSNGGAQFFSFGLRELGRRHNTCLSSKHRGVVSALLPLPGPDSMELVTQSDLQYLSTKLPVPGAGSVELAANIFTLATAIVVPFYTVMILAPKWEWTNRMMRSEIPYFILGAGYIYLLALSWTPETLSLMFSSKYWLPELAGITRMFSSSVTVASAWLHLLAVDLFAGRQVFLDGAKHNIETRHSLVLCLMMCPIGIFSHLITKNLTLFIRSRDETMKKVKEIPPY